MSENIIIALRLKPTKNTNVSVQTTKFDHFLDSSITQTEVYDKVAKNAVEWVCQGYNSSIFAYGATSSGKTFTMFGEEGEKGSIVLNSGIIPRACKYICEYEDKNVVEKEVKLSFMEIYREQLLDLLQNNRDNLRIRQTPNNEIFVQGLTEKKISLFEDISALISEGTKQRKTAATSCNNQSSRSHAILTLTLVQKFKDNTEISGKLHFIDLAGSENITKSEVVGLALSEAQNINKSLLILGNVINALTEKRAHVPYRDSKLTYLLKDSLGGNSKTILIAAVNPNDERETTNTINFARRAKEIKNAPKINKKSSIEELQQRIKILEKENEKYKKGTFEFSKIVYDNTQIECIQNFYLDRIDELNELFDRQRELTSKIRDELLLEKDKNRRLQLQLESVKYQI